MKSNQAINILKNFFYNSVLFSTTNGIRSFAINKSLEYSNNENELFMEFGVHEGKSINFSQNI